MSNKEHKKACMVLNYFEPYYIQNYIYYIYGFKMHWAILNFASI